MIAKKAQRSVAESPVGHSHSQRTVLYLSSVVLQEGGLSANKPTLPLQINPLNKLPPKPSTFPLLPFPPPHKRPLPPHIHRIITTLREPILPLPIMRDDRTVHRTAKVFTDTPDHDPVRTRGRTVVGGAGLEDGEFEIRGGGVGEAEVLVVVVGVGVFITA